MSNVRVFSTVILMLILAVIPVVQAKQIFYNSLSQKAIKDAGGIVLVPSEKAGEAVSFPTDGQLLLEAGSIALWGKS